MKIRRRRRRFAAREVSPRLRALALLLAVIAALLLLDARVRPALRAVAALQGRSLAVSTVNQTVADTLADSGYAYTDLVTIATNAEGTITALSTDIVKMNLLKSQLLFEINGRINALSERKLKIPLGSASGIDLLAGRGPRIGVRLSMTGDSNAYFDNQFESAGINQTRHRVMLYIKTRIYILLPGNNSFEEIESECCVAETIIVGVVPDVVAQFE